MEQLEKLRQTADWQLKGVNVGLFFYLDSFFTAVRQLVAQNQKISMDELQLALDFAGDDKIDSDSFLVTKFWMEGV